MNRRTATPAGGGLRFAVHTPPDAEPGAALALVCMLHGCTQDSAGFAAATRMNETADRHGFVVVYPEQDRGANPQGCWNWFLAEPYGSATSVGAAFAAMARGTDHAEPGGALHRAMASHARAIASIVVRGSADKTVAPVNGHQVLSQAIAANRLAAPRTCGDLDIGRPSATSRGRRDGGHAYTRARWTDARGRLLHELLQVEGLGHAWSGGAPGRPHSDARGPDASEAIWRFFQQSTAEPAAD